MLQKYFNLKSYKNVFFNMNQKKVIENVCLSGLWIPFYSFFWGVMEPLRILQKPKNSQMALPLGPEILIQKLW